MHGMEELSRCCFVLEVPDGIRSLKSLAHFMCTLGGLLPGTQNCFVLL